MVIKQHKGGYKKNQSYGLYHKEINIFCLTILSSNNHPNTPLHFWQVTYYTQRTSCKTKYKNSAKNVTEIQKEHIHTHNGLPYSTPCDSSDIRRLEHS